MGTEKTTTVTINEQYCVEIDAFNHTLYENYKSEKDGSPKRRFIGYYPDLKWCLRKVTFLSSLTGEELSLDSYIKRLEKLSIN